MPKRPAVSSTIIFYYHDNPTYILSAAAVKGSTVKIAGRDILATWKILVGLVLLPMLYAFYSLCMLVAVLQTDWDLRWKLMLPAATWVMLPFVSYASLRFGEIGIDILR